MKSKSNDQQKYNISAKRDLTAFKELQSFSVYINLFSQTEINGMTRSVFKIIVEDNISHHKFIGYSLEKNKNNIDIFVNYVLSNLEMRGGLDKNYKLFTGRNLISNEDQQPSDLGKIKKAKVIRNNLSHKEILGSIYKELIFNEGYAELEGYTETKNPILPPLFVDSFIRDFDKITKLTDYWRNQKINENDNMILKDTLSEAAHEVEKYQDNFDFDKALKFYKRLNIAAVELADSEKLSAQFLLKQVKIYFHLEQYDKCKEMIETNLKRFEDIKLKDEVGEIYYYLGMIMVCTNKNQEADDNFAKSSKMLSKTALPEKTTIYYRSRIRRFILKKDYPHAISLLNESIRNAVNIDSNKELSYLYGLKAEILIRNFKHNLALEALEKQLEYARSSNDLVSEAKSISQMFSVRSYLNIFKSENVKDDLNRIKKITKTIKKNSYYYNCLISYAIFLYKKDDLDEAENCFKKALKIYTAETSNINSHIVNMLYLSRIQVTRKNYYGAVMLLCRMLGLCEHNASSIYKAYIYNSLGKIYFEQRKYKKSNLNLNKSIDYIRKDNLTDKVLVANTYMYSGYNNYFLNKYKTALNHLSESAELYQEILSKEYDDQIQEYVVSINSKIQEILSISR